MNLLGMLIPPWLIVVIALAGVGALVGGGVYIGTNLQYARDLLHFTEIIKGKDDEITGYKDRAAKAQADLNQKQQELIKANLDYADQLKAKDLATATAVLDAGKRYNSLHDAYARLSAASRGDDPQATPAARLAAQERAVLLRNSDEAASRYTEVAGIAAALSTQVTGLQDWVKKFCPTQGD